MSSQEPPPEPPVPPSAAKLTGNDASLKEYLRRLNEAEQAKYKQLRDTILHIKEDLLQRLEAMDDRLLKEGRSFESHAGSRLAELSEGLGSVSESGRNLERMLEELQALVKTIHLRLAQPEKAKDVMLSELESEKDDLLKALKDRNEQLKAFAAERREVESSLGESIMEAGRQLEDERAKTVQARQEASALSSKIAALKAELELSSKEVERRESRRAEALAERDRLEKALAEETARLQKQAAERREAERAWADKEAEHERQLSDERHARLEAERTVSDLRRQLQALSDHVARIVREKEDAKAGFSNWEQERKALAESLRQKEEMLGMLSATFKNLLNKPT